MSNKFKSRTYTIPSTFLNNTFTSIWLSYFVSFYLELGKGGAHHNKVFNLIFVYPRKILWLANKINSFTPWEPTIPIGSWTRGYGSNFYILWKLRYFYTIYFSRQKLYKNCTCKLSNSYFTWNYNIFLVLKDWSSNKKLKE